MFVPSAPASPDFRIHRRAAFTLIELLVSISVLVVLVTFMAQALNQTSQLWTHGEANTRAFQTARSMSDAICAELRTTLLPVNRETGQGLQFIVNPTQISATYKNPNAFFWQAPVAADQTLGDAAEVGYFVQWDTSTTPNNPKALLCRFCVNPGSNYVPDPNFLIYSQPTAWLSNSILQTVAPATATGYQGLFAEDVVGIWVHCLDSYGQPITLNYAGVAFAGGGFDSRLGYTDSQGVQSPAYTAASGQKQPLCALPPMVEVSIALMDTNVASRINPSQQTAIMSLIAHVMSGNPNANARDFLNAALQANSGLNSISSGLHAYVTKVYLQNSN